MSCSSRGTPRGHKFALIKGIPTDSQRHRPAPAASRSKDPAPPADEYPTLAAVEQQDNDIAFTESCDEKVRRHRYALTVLRMINESSQYLSVSLFVEAMLGEARESHDSDLAKQAALGTWALNLLAAQSTSRALSEISAAITPAMYCHYSPSALSRASAAVKAQVRDPAVIEGNPYFTHSMYVEEVALDKQRVVELGDALRQSVRANDTRRNFVVRLIDASRTKALRTAFRAWRGHSRRARTLSVIVESRCRRHDSAVKELQLHAAFQQWRMAVELSRSAFLTERLHDAAAQLENAKNQFQLQCHHTDRLMQSSKELREAHRAAAEVSEELQCRVDALSAELTRKTVEFNERLASSVNDALLLVRSYARFARVLANARRKPLPFQLRREMEEEEDTLLAHAAAADEGSTAPTAEGRSATSGSRGSLSNSNAAATMKAAAASVVSGVWADSPAGSDDTEALAVIRHWCNAVLSDVHGERAVPLRSFGADFASGEAYLVILNYVFPETTSLVPNQESNTMYRLRKIKEMSTTSRVVHTLDPADFTDRREDRIIQSLCELYARYLDRQWKDNTVGVVASFMEEARQDVAKDEDPKAGEGQDSSIITDETSFRQLMASQRAQLNEMREELVGQSTKEQELADSLAQVQRMEAYLAQEDRSGLPLLHLDELSARPFWQLKPRVLEDLKDAAKIGSDARMWVRLMAGPFPQLLRRSTSLTSRLFAFYAGHGVKTMAEYAFWRFVEARDVCSSALPKEVVARVFDRVASPQLETALRAASVGRSEMDFGMMINVARQEIDLRQISASQFVEILIRLGVEAHGQSYGLLDGVGRFLKGLQLPSPLTLSPMLASFYDADSRGIVHFFSDDLARVFFFYMKRQQTSRDAKERAMAAQDGGRFGAVLSHASYLSILEECRFVSSRGGAMEEEPGTIEIAQYVISDKGARAFITSSQVLECVTALLKAYPSLRDGEIPFTIFLESLGLLSYFWCPNPLVPPSRKLAAFIAHFIGQLSTRHANSTLILGTPPYVVLEGGPKVDLTLRADSVL